jgi:hypothetical protein
VNLPRQGCRARLAVSKTLADQIDASLGRGRSALGLLWSIGGEIGPGYFRGVMSVSGRSQCASRISKRRCSSRL